MILVTGATGNVGRQLVTMLLDDCPGEVRALTRRPERAALPAGVDVVRGDFDDVDSLTAAMRGVDRVFLVTSWGPEMTTQDSNVARVAAEAGVRRIVRVSIAGLDDGDQDAVSTWHRAGEQAIDRVGVPRTFLRCGEFMTTALRWAETIRSAKKAYVPFAESPSAPIDPLDIAAVAARCLTDRAEGGSEALTVTGPEILTPADRVARLGTLLDEDLECVNLSRAEELERAAAAGYPTDMVSVHLDMIELKTQGRGATVTDTVQAVTGRPPHTFDEWAARHIEVFR